ncbi:MAG: VWA domain-containing protein [Acidobacteriota bacterium]
MTRFILAIVLVFALLGSPCTAREEPVPLFDEMVDVRVINVEVVVTDGSGQRVVGLPPSTFELLVDGSPVTIEYFSETRDGHAVASGAEVWQLPALEADVEVGRSILVFIDDFFTVAARRDRALDALRDQLSLVGPRDRMAIVAYDGTRLDMLSTWTSELNVLERALEAAVEREAQGLKRRLKAPSGEEDAEHLDQAVDAVVSTLQGFARPPGRKILLLYAGTWPAGALPDGRGSFTSAEARIDRLAAAANRLGYTVYPVDVGDRGLSLLTAAGEQTGGSALYRRQRAVALENVTDDTRSYYLLGFSPTDGENAQRTIEVMVDDPGLEVRTRRGFDDFSRDSELDMRALSTLLFGGGRASGLGVELGEATPMEDLVTVPLTLTVPKDVVSFLDQGAGQKAADLDLRTVTRDVEGAHSDVERQSVRVVIDGAIPTTVEVATSVTVSREARDMALTLHDPLSGRVIDAVVSLVPEEGR